MSVLLDKTIPILLLVIIVFTALAHGAVEPWSIALCSAGLVALLLLWLFKAVIDRHLIMHLPAPVCPLIGLILLGAVQSIAWTDQAGRRMSLSLDVEATRQTVLFLSLLLIAFLVAANFFARRTRLAALTKFLVIYGLALSLFSLVQYALWDGRFYWVRYISTEEITAPFGPFVHHGHYAGYMELLLPLPVAMLVLRCVPGNQRFLYGCAATLMGLSVVVSLARGGMLSLAVQLILLAVWGSRLTRERQDYQDYAADHRSPLRLMFARVGVVAAITATITLGLFWIGVEPVLNRIAAGQVVSGKQSSETFFASRGWIWRDALTMFRAHPLTGVGLGAFDTAFSTYTKSDGSLRVAEAHNDYLQALSDGGLVGGALAAWFVVAILRLIWKGMSSSDPLRAALALGAGTSIVGMLVHSFFDFNLQLPAQALLFLLMVAVVAQSAAAPQQEHEQLETDENLFGHPAWLASDTASIR